jgi:lipopolysaccharide/colanic/teichoic acid biosynthesis glycosyltransferase
MDIVLSASALLLLSPLFAVIALLVVLDSRGPVFFRADRVGFRVGPCGCSSSAR